MSPPRSRRGGCRRNGPEDSWLLPRRPVQSRRPWRRAVQEGAREAGACTGLRADGPDALARKSQTCAGLRLPSEPTGCHRTMLQCAGLRLPSSMRWVASALLQARVQLSPPDPFLRSGRHGRRVEYEPLEIVSELSATRSVRRAICDSRANLHMRIRITATLNMVGRHCWLVGWSSGRFGGFWS